MQRHAIFTGFAVFLSFFMTFQALAQNEVGIIPDRSGRCPAGSEIVEIKMDDEDRDNKNARAGWIGATVSNGNTTFTFCRVRGDAFKPLFYNVADPPTASINDLAYAVLKLSAKCPKGAVSFARYFDNENKRNENWVKTSLGQGIRPNSQGSVYLAGSQTPHTYLNFCLFIPSQSAQQNPDNMMEFPILGAPYGVFASPRLPQALATGYVYTDDQDDARGLFGRYRNQNSFEYSSPRHKGIAENMIYGDNKGTTLRFAKVTDTYWTEWLNRDTPGGSGDWETFKDFQKAGLACQDPLDVQCQTIDGRDWKNVGQTYSCDTTGGGICRNADQVGGQRCLDYRVRFRCR